MSAAVQAIADDPACASRAWFLVGAARHRQQRLEEALSAMQRALSLDLELDEARKACVVLLIGLKRPREAWPLVEELSRRNPRDIGSIVDTGIVLEQLGDMPAALVRYNQALKTAPGDFRARLNRGALLARIGRLEEALLDNQALVRSYIGSAMAHYNLADVLLRLDRYAEALSAIECALRLEPTVAEYFMLHGLVLAMLERDAEASDSFARAYELNPGQARHFRAAAAAAVGLAEENRLTHDPRQIRLARLLERQKSCDWAERERLIRGLREVAEDLRRTPMQLEEMGLYHTALSLPLTAGEQQALAQGIALAVLARVEGGKPARQSTPRNGKIRLGFLSPDFRDHPAAHLHWRQLAGHDRKLFEIFGYALYPGDGSFPRQRCEESCDEFCDVSSLSAQEITARIAHDGIDILVDITGYLDFARPEILALRPAPLQVSYLGLPATMGADFVDYRITDSYTTPPGESACWNEKLAYLPETLWLYNDQEMLDERKPERAECGLPERAFVFCCFNAAYKIEPDAFSVWMRLLGNLPGSVLWLLDAGPTARRNLRKEAAARGVAPERLIFAPRLPLASHLARHACADLFLDTFYCGAHTTASDALWAGLPVLTKFGQTMASRIAASLVRAVGLPELVTSGSAEYEATALRLATYPEELAVLRAKLEQNRSTCALFNTARRIRELDHAFMAMWERHKAGLPPESFVVPLLAERAS